MPPQGTLPTVPRNTRACLGVPRLLGLLSVLLAPSLLAAISLLGGCDGLLRVEDATDPVSLSGLGPTACPEGWTGSELPASLQEGLDEAMTLLVQDMQHRIASETHIRMVGTVTSVRLDYFVLHTTSATGILTSQSTLGFIDEFTLHIESTRVGSKLEPAILAKHDRIAETATAVVLSPGKTNLQPFFKEGYRVRAEVSPRTCLLTDIQLRMSFGANVRYQDE